MSVSSCIEESMNFIEAAGYMSAAIANQSQVIIATIEKIVVAHRFKIAHKLYGF